MTPFGPRGAVSAPDTAVVMSVYAKDSPERFRAAMNSILAQSYQGHHVFLMVDGPVSVELAATIRDVVDSRVFVTWGMHQRGLADSMNVLIDHVLKGPYEFIARMDSDDVSETERLRRQTEFLRTNGSIDIVGTFCQEIDDEGELLFLKRLPTSDAALKRRMLARCPFIHPTVVFRRRVFEGGIRYSSGSHLTEDMFLWVDCAKAGFVFGNVPEPLLRYRVDARFYERRSGIRKAVSEYRAKRYIATQLGAEGVGSVVWPLLAFGLRLLPTPLLRLCYQLFR